MRRYGPLEILLGCLMSALAMVVFVQVVIRYVTYQPLAWTEEIARLLFIWACMIGAAEGCRRGVHFSVNLLATGVRVRWARWLRLSLRVLETAFYALLTWAGFLVARVANNQHSVSLEYPM